MGTLDEGDAAGEEGEDLDVVVEVDEVLGLGVGEVVVETDVAEDVNEVELRLLVEEVDAEEELRVDVPIVVPTLAPPVTVAPAETVTVLVM